jgi:hypothetical protein
LELPSKSGGKRAKSFGGDEMKILPAGDRPVAKWLLLSVGHIHHIIADEVEQPSDFEAGQVRICEGFRMPAA